jgi:hypothetical protein
MTDSELQQLRDQAAAVRAYAERLSSGPWKVDACGVREELLGLVPARQLERPFPHGFTRVQGRCPACRHSALFLGDGGYITCGNLQCTDPAAATDMLEQP